MKVWCLIDDFLGEAKDETGVPCNSNTNGGRRSALGRDRCVKKAKVKRQGARFSMDWVSCCKDYRF